MFDLVTGQTRHIPSTPAVPFLLSISAQLALVTGVMLPVFFFTGALPEVPTMIAFVAAMPTPPPPPPPPAPPAQKTVSPEQSAPTPKSDAAPVDAPSTISPERPIDTGDIGVPRGVEGGIPGGIVGGVPGGLLSEIPPPPPPPPAPAPPRAPVRVGGQIKPPELVRRVEPIYPDVAVSARLTGTVILEAQVDKEGRHTVISQPAYVDQYGRVIGGTPYAMAPQYDIDGDGVVNRHDRVPHDWRYR